MAQSASAVNIPMCVLFAKDGEKLQLPIDVAKTSITIKNMLEDLGEVDGDENIIPIPAINGDVLKKIFEYCCYINAHPLDLDEVNKWIEDTKFEFPLTEWFVEYLKIEQELLIEIILGANFLDINSLLRMACKQVASLIRNKSPEELRELFRKPEEAVAVAKAAASTLDDDDDVDVVE